MKGIHLTIVMAIIAIAMSGCLQHQTDSLPNFKLLLPDSNTVLRTREIKKGQKLVFIHFDADCHECQMETDSLLKHMRKLKDVQFYFLTVGKFSQVKIFRNYYHLERYPNVIVGQDYNKSFPEHFKTRTTPLLAVYDKKKKLVAVFEGRADMDKLLSTIGSIE